MADYQRKTLVPLADVGLPGPLPADLQGLADVSLADLPVAIGEAAAEQLGYLNTGFFPVPAPPVVIGVTNTQLRIALLDAGFLPDVEVAVGTLPQAAQIRWQYNSAFVVDEAVIVAIFDAALIDPVTREAVFAAAALVPDG